MSKIKIGTSSCLLGENVRWNGGHCHSKYIKDWNEDYEFVSVCPEVGIGLGIPRPTIRLVEDIEDIEDIGKNLLVSSKTGEDFTKIMEEYSREKVEELKSMSINGFILKSKSPTCGLRVKVYKSYDTKGATKNGVGVFAKILSEYWPELPITEEGRLNDSKLREKFEISTECHKDWVENVTREDINTLIDFHQRHKYLLESLNMEKKKELGVMVANQKSIKDVFGLYYTEFFLTLKNTEFTTKKICNVYARMFDKLMSEYITMTIEDRRDFHNYLGMVKSGKLDKLIPKVLLKQYVRKNCDSYLEDQKNLLL